MYAFPPVLTGLAFEVILFLRFDRSFLPSFLSSFEDFETFIFSIYTLLLVSLFPLSLYLDIYIERPDSTLVLRLLASRKAPRGLAEF